MHSYRAYLLDEQGHVRSAHVLVCDDDATAMAAAEPFALDGDVEVWDGDRKLGLLKRQG